MGVVSPPNDVNIGPLLNRVSIAVYVTAVLFVGLRFYMRVFVVKKFGADDYFIGLAVVLGAAQTATIVLQVESGRGRHAWMLSIEEFNNMLMYKWINWLVYYATNWSVKMSILALYHRIGSSQRGLRWILNPRVVIGMATFVSAYTISMLVAQLFGCNTVSENWDVQRKPDPCMRVTEFNIIQSSINVFTDLLLFVCPLPLLTMLKINIKQRTALAGIFSVGLIPLVASIIRLVEVVITTSGNDVSRIEADTSWRWAWVPIWSQIECTVGIIAASLPSLSPLLKQVWSGFTMQRSSVLFPIRTLDRSIEDWTLQELPSASTGVCKKGQSLSFCDNVRAEEGVGLGSEDTSRRYSNIQTSPDQDDPTS